MGVVAKRNPLGRQEDTVQLREIPLEKNLCQKDGTVHRREKSGRPKKTTEKQDRAIARQIKKDPNKSATDAASYAKDTLGVEITTRTARNILKRHDLHGRRPAHKPRLLKRHRKARMAFVRMYQHWTKQDWAKVLWSDEVKLNLFNPDGGHYVRRPKEARFKERYTRGTVKFGGGNIMVWGKMG